MTSPAAVRIGIIGVGRISRWHAASLRALEGVMLAGVYDIDQSASERFRIEHECKSYQDFDDLLASVDGVIVAVPNNSHPHYVLRSIQAGKHVLCEKPMASRVEDAREMCTNLPDHLVGAVGFNYRFLPIAGMLTRLLEQGQFGAVTGFEARFLKNSAYRRTAFDWRDSEEQAGSSGSLGDLGSHLLDMAFNLLHSCIIPEEMSCSCRTNVPTKEGRTVWVDDFADAHCTLSCGTRFRLVTSKSHAEDNLGVTLRITGTKQELLYSTAMGSRYKTLDVTTNTCTDHNMERKQRFADPENEVFGWADSILDQMEDWTASIRDPSRTRSAATFRDGLIVQEALQAFLDAAKGSP